MKKVLYADDEEMNLAIVEAFLDGHYDIKVVDSGQSCLDAINAEVPDLLLLDHMMPDIDGFGVLQQLRADDATKHLTVVMVSANAYKEDRQNAINHGADGYLAKPFDEDQLLDVVAKFIESP